jgi:hypothetical protein
MHVKTRSPRHILLCLYLLAATRSQPALAADPLDSLAHPDKQQTTFTTRCADANRSAIPTV